jgi:hypothetical protein
MQGAGTKIGTHLNGVNSSSDLREAVFSGGSNVTTQVAFVPNAAAFLLPVDDVDSCE